MSTPPRKSPTNKDKPFNGYEEIKSVRNKRVKDLRIPNMNRLIKLRQSEDPES